MCDFNPRNDSRFIDPCMRMVVFNLRLKGFNVVACCCGHGRYSKTIMVKVKGEAFELLTNRPIPRKKKFYRRDKDGYFYIPEVDHENNAEGR